MMAGDSPNEKDAAKHVPTPAREEAHNSPSQVSAILQIDADSEISSTDVPKRLERTESSDNSNSTVKNPDLNEYMDKNVAKKLTPKTKAIQILLHGN